MIMTKGIERASRPIIGITMGDPAGVGAEVIVKALLTADVWETCLPVVIGDINQMRRTATFLQSKLPLEEINASLDVPQDRQAIFVLQVGQVPADLPLGQLSPQAGEAAYQYVIRATELATSGKIEAICTAPLNKEALHAAGHLYPGHTELLAELTGRKDFAMVLIAPDLRVIHVSTHVGLKQAIARATREREEKVIAIGAAFLQKIGIAQPRIAVCGINPHAGEHGLFGEGEEEREIIPAVEAMRQRGYNVSGPLPPDTVFLRARHGEFDLVIAQYHDQGHIPIKSLGMESGVNVTAGLPILRTSVDHGTAFDIAGKGIADAQSMVEAIRLAAQLAQEAGKEGS
ncbi:MAG TPA: 4-hydroxythreonine-4-phosphate dehydrogenase PdxA [Ktedonobacteraceae bacterium]|jgi:4-hydroxythreonine-4-phosphate dehydrogenase